MAYNVGVLKPLRSDSALMIHFLHSQKILICWSLKIVLDFVTFEMYIREFFLSWLQKKKCTELGLKSSSRCIFFIINIAYIHVYDIKNIRKKTVFTSKWLLMDFVSLAAFDVRIWLWLIFAFSPRKSLVFDNWSKLNKVELDRSGSLLLLIYLLVIYLIFISFIHVKVVLFLFVCKKISMWPM